MPGTMTLPDGYSRAKKPPTAQYREMAPDEARGLQVGQRVPFRAMDGTARELTVNGRPKTWKLDPGRLEVPCKYGMYEYATFYAQGGQMLSGGGAVLLVKLGG